MYIIPIKALACSRYNSLLQGLDMYLNKDVTVRKPNDIAPDIPDVINQKEMGNFVLMTFYQEWILIH